MKYNPVYQSIVAVYYRNIIVMNIELLKVKGKGKAIPVACHEVP
jgi:hypothetical protein